MFTWVQEPFAAQRMVHVQVTRHLHVGIHIAYPADRLSVREAFFKGLLVVVETWCLLLDEDEIGLWQADFGLLSAEHIVVDIPVQCLALDLLLLSEETKQTSSDAQASE